MSRAHLPHWPAAMRAPDAAEYCGLGLEQFRAICPVKPMELAPGVKRFPRWRLDEWRAWLDPEDIPADMPANSGVYFLRGGDFIKIGHSDDVTSRVKMIQTGSPYELVVMKIVAGRPWDEKAFHREFSDLHVRGEWFRFDGELREWLEASE